MLLWEQHLPFDLEGWARTKFPNSFKNIHREMRLQAAIQDLYHVSSQDRDSWIKAETKIFTILGLPKARQAVCLIESVSSPSFQPDQPTVPIVGFLGTKFEVQGLKKTQKRKHALHGNVTPVEAPLPKIRKPALPEPATVSPAVVIHDQIRDLKRTVQQATKRSFKLKAKLQDQQMRLKQTTAKHDRMKSSLVSWSPQSQRDEVTSLAIIMDQQQESADVFQDKVDDLTKKLLGMTSRLEILKARQLQVTRQK